MHHSNTGTVEGSEDGRWMELAQDRVQWRALVSAVLTLRVLLLEGTALYIRGIRFVCFSSHQALPNVIPLKLRTPKLDTFYNLHLK
jgi:hypothetical protein